MNEWGKRSLEVGIWVAVRPDYNNKAYVKSISIFYPHLFYLESRFILCMCAGYVYTASIAFTSFVMT
jgi:hypothetical protein